MVKMDGNQTILAPPPEAEERMRKGGKGTDGQKTFAFDRSYWSFDRSDKNFAGQDSLYKDLGIPLLDNAVSPVSTESQTKSRVEGVPLS